MPSDKPTYKTKDSELDQNLNNISPEQSVNKPEEILITPTKTEIPPPSQESPIETTGELFLLD